MAEKLKDNWLTDGLIDFEYKKYILLAYLQTAKNTFSEQKLYPTFSDLLFHYKNLLSIRDGKELLYQNFPKEISLKDFQQLRLSYQQIVEDDETMAELTEIILYAIPRFKGLLENGKELYETISSHLDLEPVGITPIQPNEGYLFLNPYRLKDTYVYRYNMSFFESSEEKYRGIQMRLLEKTRKGLGETYEHLKLRLIRQYKELPNPATFLLIAKVPCPFEESLLPVSKRLLMVHLAKLAS